MVGLVVVLVVGAIAQGMGADPWPAAAVTGVAVGAVHGALFWVLRAKRRRERARVLADVQRMLKDVINNQLAVITIATGMTQEQATRSGLAVAAIERSVGTIGAALQDLSEDSLARWQARYASTESRPLGAKNEGTGLRR